MTDLLVLRYTQKLVLTSFRNSLKKVATPSGHLSHVWLTKARHHCLSSFFKGGQMPMLVLRHAPTILEVLLVSKPILSNK